MRLNYKQTFFVGLAFLSIAAFWQMYDNIIPLILKNTFHLNESITGIIMSADNVLAVILLPLIGGLSDKVDTKWGKRTPFIVGGTIAAIACMMVLPFADRSGNLILFIIMLGATLFAMAMYRSPAVALMPDLTPKPLRSKANAVINLMGAIGGVYALILISSFVSKTTKADYFLVFAGIALIMAVAVILLLATTKEKKLLKEIAEEYPEEEEKKGSMPLEKGVQRSLFFILLSIFLWFTSYNAVTTAFSRYATSVWGLEGGGFANCLMVATVAAILSYIPIGFISSKIGRKKSILIGIVLMFLSYGAAFFYTDFHPSINIAFACIGVGWAAISVNSLPMVVEMSKGSDIGKYTGLYYTFSMSAQIVTPIFSGILLQYISYRTLFPYAVFFTTLAFITMLMVKHGDSKPMKKKNVLDNYDVED